MATAASPLPAPPHHGFVTGLGVAQIVAWGTLLYAFPLLAGPMAAELGWSKAETYLLASLSLAVSGLAAVPVGTAIDRGHGRAVMAGGSALAALMLWGWGQATETWQLVLVFVGIGLAQAMTLYEPGFAVIARRFGARARQGITALTLWGGFASTVFIPVTQAMLDRVGWRGTLEGLALATLVLCLPLHLLVVRPDLDPPPEPPAPGAGDGRALPWALRQPAFWGLALAFTVYYATFTGLTYHLYPLLAERGLESAAIVGALALVGPAQVAGRVAVAALAARASIRAVGVASTLVLPLVLTALLLLGNNLVLLAAFALAYGAVNGIMTIVRGAAVPEMLTRQAYGAINGALTLPTAVVRALAPMLAALLWEASGSYDGVLAACIAAMAVVAASFWLAARASPRP